METKLVAPEVDRLLLAQARSEGMFLLTCDSLLLGYGEPFLVDARFWPLPCR